MLDQEMSLDTYQIWESLRGVHLCVCVCVCVCARARRNQGNMHRTLQYSETRETCTRLTWTCLSAVSAELGTNDVRCE
jgi:hypothetical protein